MLNYNPEWFCLSINEGEERSWNSSCPLFSIEAFSCLSLTQLQSGSHLQDFRAIRCSLSLFFFSSTKTYRGIYQSVQWIICTCSNSNYNPHKQFMSNWSPVTSLFACMFNIHLIWRLATNTFCQHIYVVLFLLKHVAITLVFNPGVAFTTEPTGGIIIIYQLWGWSLFWLGLIRACWLNPAPVALTTMFNTSDSSQKTVFTSTLTDIWPLNKGVITGEK